MQQQSRVHYLLFTPCSFDSSKYKHDFCRDKNSMRELCRDLGERATKTTEEEI